MATYTDTTDGSGNFLFGFSEPVIPAGHYVTAVAYEDPAGETSELSMCRRDHPTCPWPPDLVLTDATIVGPQSFTACETITTDGAFGVGALSSATMSAGVSVAFGNGLSAIGDLTVNLDPALAVP